MMQSQTPVLALTNIAFERYYHYLFKNVKATLHHGDCLQIHGANGSGKSTLLRMIAGFIEVEQGDILWQGESIKKQRFFYSRQLHYIGHQNGLKPYLTVYENIALSCALGMLNKTHSEIKQILAQIGLSHLIHVQTHQLSAGQQRRLSLARLLIKQLTMWILDEPTTALDREGKIWLMNLIQTHLFNGGIAIIATHHDLELLQNNKTIIL